jgi:hypothetical protein
MRCFFLMLTNTLKQPAILHFITSGLQNLLRSYKGTGKLLTIIKEKLSIFYKLISNFFLYFLMKNIFS